MTKQRTIPSNLGDAPEIVEVDHLDGGTFGIELMDFDSAARYGELITRTELERDPSTGSILFNQKSGAPARKWATTTTDEVEFAASKVAYVTNLRNEKSMSILTWRSGDDADAKKILALLKLQGTSEYLLDAEGNEFIGSPGQVKATEIPKKKDRAGERTSEPLPGASVRDSGAVIFTFEEPIFKWVMRESARLRREANEVLRKNSSPTQ